MIPLSIVGHESEINGVPGKEHYYLLKFLSCHLDNDKPAQGYFRTSQAQSPVMIDIGTHVGMSAWALGSNPHTELHTWDIIDRILESKKTFTQNIKFHLEDLWDEETWDINKDLILNSKLVFQDTDPHNGHMEYQIYQRLKEAKYTGYMLFDDIHYFADMRQNFWQRIPEEHKLDITYAGHWSGCGLVCFHPEKLAQLGKDIKEWWELNWRNK